MGNAACSKGRGMDAKPIHIVDTLHVVPSRREALLDLLKNEGIPAMRDAGLELLGCWSTLDNLGEDVLIQVTWRCADHSAFNVMRKNFVLDPRWHSYAAKASKLWHGGTRRFFYPTGIA
jgi:hypothetical protein